MLLALVHIAGPVGSSWGCRPNLLDSICPCSNHYTALPVSAGARGLAERRVTAVLNGISDVTLLVWAVTLGTPGGQTAPLHRALPSYVLACRQPPQAKAPLSTISVCSTNCFTWVSNSEHPSVSA